MQDTITITQEFTAVIAGAPIGHVRTLKAGEVLDVANYASGAGCWNAYTADGVRVIVPRRFAR